MWLKQTWPLNKATISQVAQAVQLSAHVERPCSVLHGLPNAAFYVTRGAAKHLVARQVADIEAGKCTLEEVEDVLVGLCMKKSKRLVDLTEADAAADPAASALMVKRTLLGDSLGALATKVHDSLVAKITAGITTYTNTKFLHTEPHHDDIMLGYLPMVTRAAAVGSNDHLFVCCTSGFNSVSNAYLAEQLHRVRAFVSTAEFAGLASENYFDQSDANRRKDVFCFLDGAAAGSNQRTTDLKLSHITKQRIFIIK